MTRGLEETWICPCGFQGSFAAVEGHRKGYRKRPECSGKMSKLVAGVIGGGQLVISGSIPTPESGWIGESSLQVDLPGYVVELYEWAKSQGWSRGDGSLSTFVGDVLRDYFENAIGLRFANPNRGDDGSYDPHDS